MGSFTYRKLCYYIYMYIHSIYTSTVEFINKLLLHIIMYNYIYVYTNNFKKCSQSTSINDTCHNLLLTFSFKCKLYVKTVVLFALNFKPILLIMCALKICDLNVLSFKRL